ncbi:MAG: hypothetical protein ABIN96_01040 [Rubrivivax sp.]
MNPGVTLSFRAIAVTLALISSSLQAQQLVVATGEAGNTYDLMAKQLGQACERDAGRTIVSKPSSGSMDNIDRLLNNEVPAAMVQTDVLRYRQSRDDLSQIKALFQLHPEEVHVLALSGTRSFGKVPAVDGFAGIPGLGVPFNTLADLRGRKVGAWGGSLVTAQVIRLQAEIDFQLVEFADAAAALKALTDKSVDALVSVGGSPQPWVQRLDRQFRLVPIAEADALKLKSFYRRAKLSYGNLGQTGVQTVATDAVLAVRDYKTPAMSAMLLWARGCFSEHLAELQETPGTQATWQKIDSSIGPNWSPYIGTKAKATDVKAKVARR